MKNGSLWIVFYIGIFLLMYLIIIFPQRKQEKKKKAMLNTLNIGDEILTIGGVHARVVTVRDNDLTVQLVDEKVRMKIEKWAIREVTKRVEEKAKKAEKTEVEDDKDK